MPIYEYRCNNCNHEFETIQKISEPPLQTCPSCEHDELVKKISAAGFRLKGSGWYETDFKSGNKRNVSDGDGSSSSTESSSGDGDSSSKSGKESAGDSSESAKKSAAAGESKSKSAESKSSKSDSS
jgi:putative FmdB family regulatory protein